MENQRGAQRPEYIPDRVIVQRMFARAERLARAKGKHGWADFARSQHRLIVKNDRLSPEQAGYARQALRALEPRS